MLDFVGVLVVLALFGTLCVTLGLLQRRPSEEQRVPLRRQLPPVVAISDSRDAV